MGESEQKFLILYQRLLKSRYIDCPKNENKKCFFSTILCLGYSENEFKNIQHKDFTTYFLCTLGARPNVIDVLTILHNALNFDDAEKNMTVHKINNDLELKLVSYDVLKDT